MASTLNKAELLARITFNPRIFNGLPIIRGYRMTVAFMLGMLANGSTERELLEEYDWLETEDIQACLLYASDLAGRDHFYPRSIEEPVSK
jgi:uncharacterized protein (DUF433 family)